MEISRTHRVGTITTGIMLIGFGVLFILHLFLSTISYEFIFKLWPLTLIGLGVEILLANFAKDKVIYDKGAVILMMLVTFFAMGMASADWIFTHLS